MELQRGKRRAFREDEPVSLLADLASKPSWQTILELKDPRDLLEDLVFSLMEGGRPLTVVEGIRPIFRALPQSVVTFVEPIRLKTITAPPSFANNGLRLCVF